MEVQDQNRKMSECWRFSKLLYIQLERPQYIDPGGYIYKINVTAILKTVN